MSTLTFFWRLILPDTLRAIFGRWGEPYDPALTAVQHITPDQSRRLYQELGQAVDPVNLSREALAQIEADACFNGQFGQCAELRREGERVLPWARTLLAAGPAAHHIFIP